MIKRITLFNFRRFSYVDLLTPSNLIILEGPNACGKTSILEAIYFTSTSKSHRTNDYKELIKLEEDFAKIKIEGDNLYEVIISNRGHKNSINHIEMKKISEFIGQLRCVFFSPLDLNLVTGTKSIRRNFLDLEISLLNKSYLKMIREYKKLLKERNEILKQYDSNKLSYLKLITKEMVVREEIIIKERISFLNKLEIELGIVHPSISNGEKISLTYLKSMNYDDAFSFYMNNLNKDIILKTTSYGIHRDDFKVELFNLDAKSFASQGQARNAAISIKIALVRLIEKYSKIKPILLLDDVFSELDLNRQKNLVNFLKGENQTFISTTSLVGLPKDILKDAYVIKLKE